MSFEGQAVFSAEVILLFAVLLLRILVLSSFLFIASLLRRLAHPRSVCVGFTVDKVPLGQDFLRVLLSLPVSTIQSLLLHTPLIYHRRFLTYQLSGSLK
jgi:hypothetical protein